MADNAVRIEIVAPDLGPDPQEAPPPSFSPPPPQPPSPATPPPPAPLPPPPPPQPQPQPQPQAAPWKDPSQPDFALVNQNIGPPRQPWGPIEPADYDVLAREQMLREREAEAERLNLHRARLRVDSEYAKKYAEPEWAAPPAPDDYYARAALDRANREEAEAEKQRMHEARMQADPEYARRERQRRREEQVREPEWAAPAQPDDYYARAALDREKREEAQADAKAMDAARRQADPEYARKQGQMETGVIGNALAYMGVGGTAGKVANLGLQVGQSMGLDTAALSQALAPIAGPVGAAVMLGQELQQKLLEKIDSLGDQLATAGRLDAGGMARGLNQSIGDYSLDPFGLIKPFETYAKVNEQLMKFAAALSETSKRLSQYHGALAGAEAQAEVAQVLGDIRRANLLGGELSEFTAARSRLSQAGQDALAQIVKPLIPILTSFLQGAASFLETIARGAEMVQQQISGTVKAGLDRIGSALDVLSVLSPIYNILKRLKELLGGAPDPVTPIDGFLNLNPAVPGVLSPIQGMPIDAFPGMAPPPPVFVPPPFAG